MRRSRLFWLLAVVVIATLIYLPSLSKYLKLKQKESDLEREINRLQSEISEIRKEELLLKTDLTTLETTAREVLGLVKPGEVVYKVVEEEIPEEEILPVKATSR